MTRKNNKGFSLIEVIIAVAVFAILIVPLTSQLISAVNINKKSTKKQYAVEKAEEIMESFKTADVSKDDISIPDGTSSSTSYSSYTFSKNATETENKTQELTSVQDPNDATKKLSVNYQIKTYDCSNISLGGAYETYSCKVTVNDLAYQVSKYGYIWDASTGDVKLGDDGKAVKTTSSVGTVRTLDNKQSAIITGATYLGASSGVTGNNLDNQAYDYFRDQKIDIIKDYEVYYNRYLSSGGDSYFANDTMKKTTTIKIDKSLSGKYTVSCSVKYQDIPSIGIIINNYSSATGKSDTYQPTTKYGSGIVYQQEYDTLPPVYLLYVPATSNGTYCDTDYINIDVTGLSAEEQKTAKVYLFETAADIDSKYEEIILESIYGTTTGHSLSDLVYTSGSSANRASAVKVCVNQVDASGVILDDASAEFAGKNVFANFTTNSSYDQDWATGLLESEVLENSGNLSNIQVNGTSEDTSDDVYMYDLTVTLTDSEGNETTITGTRGK